MALGAAGSDVVRLVLGEGIRLAAIGTSVGLLGGLAAARVMRGLLFDTTPADPLTFVAVPLVLALAGLVASYLPARRAVRVDPIAALR
jgi:ABC-type antimicrobial peptide transport system permease subunit